MIPKLIGYWRSVSDPSNLDDTLKQVWDATERRFKVMKGKNWGHDYRDDIYPWPAHLMEVGAGHENRIKVAAYLKAGWECNHDRGCNKCLICNDRLGDFQRTDGTWIWPDGLDHYVQEHQIRVPQEVWEHIQSLNYRMSPKNDVRALLAEHVEVRLNDMKYGGASEYWTVQEIDKTFWQEWSAKNETQSH